MSTAERDKLRAGCHRCLQRISQRCRTKTSVAGPRPALPDQCQLSGSQLSSSQPRSTPCEGVANSNINPSRRNGKRATASQSTPNFRRHRLSDSITFLKEFLRHPTRVGAIAPSSPGLVRAMVESFDWQTVRNVVEFGPGTGVFTEAVAKNLHPEAKFVAIEQGADMVQTTRQRCPDVNVIHGSATDLNSICEAAGIGQIDAVVCGLPWASFPESLQTEIMDVMLDRMADGATFATFAYWQGVILPAGLRFSKRLKRSFSEVGRSNTVWRNLPPAFVYRCKK
ncbi:MAG: hypothetical protein CBB71_16235 [Rhodopirellula sp. TMED11]|nr:MAG: hypothetical protein CBB71_16235 [Rhodopirellula sp. TMED11]